MIYTTFKKRTLEDFSAFRFIALIFFPPLAIWRHIIPCLISLLLIWMDYWFSGALVAIICIEYHYAQVEKEIDRIISQPTEAPKDKIIVKKKVRKISQKRMKDV